ncbi:type I-F CRISPR-associated protein Csy2 [Carnimonas nigrificans]|uniref:type I-F CRISPR-associated protein Csy2 n=1 Tax=Carnimonas nigrificans TaxID=64323 RepID=UPI0004703D07|nr:type I-F CRISPR-associated protein Csy2 [Carnimonas nigrificans]
MIDHLLVLPRLRIQNANAISGPMTWGFPAMSAFVGVMQALERRLPDDMGLMFNGIGVICHSMEPQVTKKGITRAFHLTRNPVDKTGKTSAIVEEGRAHIDISLLIDVGFNGDVLHSQEQRNEIAKRLYHLAQGMRIAGGSVVPTTSVADERYCPRLISFNPDDSEQAYTNWRRVMRSLLPGFALVQRDDLLKAHTKTLQKDNEGATAFDAWLDLCRINHECREVEEVSSDGEIKQQVRWSIRRPYRGWLVPIPVGYAAISPLYNPGEVVNVRDPGVKFQFVESIYSIGEWVSPHRIRDPEALLWSVDIESAQQGLYRLKNFYSDSLSTAFQGAV